MVETNGFLLFVNAAPGYRGGCCDILGTNTQIELVSDSKLCGL